MQLKSDDNEDVDSLDDYPVTDLEREYVQRFKKLCERKTNRRLTDVEAVEHFRSLVELIRCVYRPVPSSKREEFERLLAEAQAKTNVDTAHTKSP